MANIKTIGYCRYLDGYKLQLQEDCEHNVPQFWLPDFKHEWFSCKLGRIWVKKGYAWDGASGPTIDCKYTAYPSLIHDVLYQAMGLGLMPNDSYFRKKTDVLFRQLLKRDGMGFARRWVWYYAVRSFGPKQGSKPKKPINSPRK